MYVREQRCFSLGIEEKAAGEYNNKKYDAYTLLHFVVFDENGSRKSKLENPQIKALAYKHCEKWGSQFIVSGEITNKGYFTIDSIDPMDDELGLL